MQPRGCRNLSFTIFSFVLYYPLALAQGPKNKTYYDSPEEEATLPLQNYRQPEQSIVNLFTSQIVLKEE